MPGLTLPGTPRSIHIIHLGSVSFLSFRLSAVCLAIHLTAFCLLSELRNLRDRCLTCLYLTLLPAFSSFFLAHSHSFLPVSLQCALPSSSPLSPSCPSYVTSVANAWPHSAWHSSLHSHHSSWLSLIPFFPFLCSMPGHPPDSVLPPVRATQPQ